MTRNVGEGDRLVRIGVGAVIAFGSVVAWTVLGYALLGAVGLAAGGFLLASGSTGVCLVYRLLDVDTCES